MDKVNILYSIPKNEYIAKQIEDNYGINIEKIVLYRISGGLVYFVNAKDNKYVFKVHTSYSMNNDLHGKAFRAHQSFNVIDYLYKNDFPMAKIYRTKDNELFTKIPMLKGDSVGALFDFIQGDDISLNGNIERIAKTTASMQKIMKNYEGQLNVLQKDFYIDRMIKMLNTYCVGNSKIKELAEFGDFAFRKIKSLPKGFCHGDYGTHNMKMKGNKIFVFDFDVASKTYPMFDIALICDTGNFWKFSEKAMLKTKGNIDRFVETYAKYCDLSQAEVDSYIVFFSTKAI